MKRWRCPKCGKRLAIRPTIEDENRFEVRFRAHLGGEVCTALVLRAELRAAGFWSMGNWQPPDESRVALSDAGLLSEHATTVHGSEVEKDCWAPGWAARYERFMRRQQEPLRRRSAALREAARSKAAIKRVEAFMALAGAPP